MKLDLDDADIERLAPRVAKEVALLLRPILAHSQQSADKIFTVETLAQYLNAKPQWIYEHMGMLPRFKLGGLLRFRKSEIDRLINENIIQIFPTAK